MKTHIYTLIKALSIFLFYQGLLLNDLKAQTTAIPDAQFEQALINLGIDSDGVINGQVLTSDIDTVVNLDLFDVQLEDLTGIEDFTALEILDVSGASLSILDVSNNIQLKELYCDSSIPNTSMLFTSLDLSNNVNLEVLFGNVLINLENLNLKNGNNEILTFVGLSCEFEGEDCILPDLHCVLVDDEDAANNNEPPYSGWFIVADFVYSETCELGANSQNTDGISIYPNPVQDILNIDFQNRDFNNATYKIVDMLGKVVMGADVDGAALIDVAQLKAGVYFIVVEMDGGVSVVERFVKE